jgi:hypothetical protein
VEIWRPCREISQNRPLDSRDIRALPGEQSFSRIGRIKSVSFFRPLCAHQLEHRQQWHLQLVQSCGDVGPDQPETAVTRYSLACILARRGSTEEALTLLRQAVDHGLQPRMDLEIETAPLLNLLHGDPRFAALVTHAKERAAAQQAN